MAPADLKSLSYSGAASKALPSVVHIFTSKEMKTPKHPFADDPIFRHFFGDRLDSRPQRSSGLGSGVIVSPEGYVLTNNHVIEAADEIEVALHDGRKLRARTVGMDPESDLAVLKIQTDVKLSAVSFATAGSVHVGDVALAIGNPFGVGQTVTMGIVSAMGRTSLGINTFEDFIQTDAAINPGNSGGALVDSNGNLIGINTAIYSRSGGSLGIGFAIPVTLARSVMEQIIRSGTVTRGWIGVEVQEITPELAESFGLASREGTLVAGVMRGGPADKAGIRPGDVLVAVEGKAIHDNHTHARTRRRACRRAAARGSASSATKRPRTSKCRSASVRRCETKDDPVSVATQAARPRGMAIFRPPIAEQPAKWRSQAT